MGGGGDLNAGRGGRSGTRTVCMFEGKNDFLVIHHEYSLCVALQRDLCLQQRLSSCH